MSPFVRPALVRRGDRLLARSVFFLLLCFYTATFTGLPDNPDAEVEFQTTSALVRTGSLALGGTPEAEALIAHGHGLRRGGEARPGRSYSYFGTGQALMAVPLYAAGAGVARLLPSFEETHRRSTHMGVGRSEYFQHLFVGWRNPVLGALTALLVVLSARRLGAGRSAAWVAGLGYGLCSFAWPQARSGLSDVQATFLLFLAFSEILRLRESFRRYRELRRFDGLLLGAALGGAVLTRVLSAPAVLVLCGMGLVVLLAARRRQIPPRLLRRAAAWTALAAATAAGFFLYMNAVRFDSPFDAGYGDDVGPSLFGYSIPLGLVSLLVSPGRGLFWLAPASLLGFLWAGSLPRRDPLLFFTLLGLFAAIALPVAATLGWHGGWTYGPRYLLPLLPFLWLGVAAFLNAPGPRRVLAWCLLALGSITNLGAVFVDYSTHTDLATQAARIEWPDPPGDTEALQEEERFFRIQWDWGFAAPWAHWRILRHRVAGLGEDFPVREIFHVDSEASVTPLHERERGFRHLAWVDFATRLGGPLWPAWGLCLGLLAAGVALAIRGLDPSTP